MSRVRVHNFCVSLDGFGAGEGQAPVLPSGMRVTGCRSGFSAPGPSAPCTASPVAARAWTTPLPATGGGHRRGDHGAEQVRPGAAVHRWRSSGSAGGGDHGDGMRLDAEPRPRLIRPIVRTSGRWYSSAESLRSIGSFWSLTGCAEHVLVRWVDVFTVFCHLSHHTPLACADASGTGSVWCCCPPDAGVRCPRRPVCGGQPRTGACEVLVRREVLCTWRGAVPGAGMHMPCTLRAPHAASEATRLRDRVQRAGCHAAGGCCV